ncbi:hypothetical protein ACI782_10155 [Geodermatophilus sp. SYSU D00703]
MLDVLRDLVAVLVPLPGPADLRPAGALTGPDPADGDARLLLHASLRAARLQDVPA